MLAESAYAAEIGGPAYRQARENLKKVRGAGPPHPEPRLRHARAHRRSLRAAGGRRRRVERHRRRRRRGQPDDGARRQGPRVSRSSSSSTSAAAAAARRDPIRVVPAPFGGDEDGEPSVAIGEHESDADRDLDAREAEESKRLLYVALTRARDRLYLARDAHRGRPICAGQGRARARAAGRRLASSMSRPASVGTRMRSLAWSGASTSRCCSGWRPCLERPSLPIASRPHAHRRLRAARRDRRRRAARSPRPTRSRGRARRARARRAPSSIEAGVLVHRALQAGRRRPSRGGCCVRTSARSSTMSTRWSSARPRRYAVAASRGRRSRRCSVESDDARSVAAARSAVLAATARRHRSCAARSTASSSIRDGRVEVLEFKTGRPRAGTRRAAGDLPGRGAGAVSGGASRGPADLRRRAGNFPVTTGV